MARHLGLQQRRDVGRHHRAVATAFDVGLVIVLAAALSAGAVYLSALIGTSAQGREIYPGQYAQVDPKVRDWFKEQRIPGTNTRCCDMSDGEYAEEDIRDGHYWTRFEKSQGVWIQVPDEAVIHEPNRNGAPVAWWFTDSDELDSVLRIKCYVPGGKT